MHNIKKLFNFARAAFRARFLITWRWLLHPTKVSGFELYRYWISCFGTAAIRDQFIEDLEDQDQWLCIKFQNKVIPLYYPKHLSLLNLYTSIKEQLSSLDWHRYEKYGTMVEPEDIVVDCGCAEGYFAYSVYNRCKHVYCIEPTHHFISALKKTFDGVEKVTVSETGASDRNETLYIQEAGVNSWISETPTDSQVELTTIDALFYEQNRPFTYLKADIEGYEMKMLRGAEKSIREYAPKIAITTYHNSGDLKAFTEFLKSVNPNYQFKWKGLSPNGEPVMLHAWVDK